MNPKQEEDQGEKEKTNLLLKLFINQNLKNQKILKIIILLISSHKKMESSLISYQMKIKWLKIFKVHL